MADATYTATRDLAAPHSVVLHATGMNPTTGYHPQFKVDPTHISPPKFDFENPRPTGIEGQIMTPFNISKSFPYPSDLDTVTILDTTGANEVEITAVPVPAR